MEGTGVFWQLRRLEPQRRDSKRNAGAWFLPVLNFSDQHGPKQPSWSSGKEEELTGHAVMASQPLSAHCGDRQDLAPWAL